MSQEEIYDFIKKKTYGVFEEGKQIKITVSEIIKALKINEQTIYRNLKQLEKNIDVHCSIYRINRFKSGKQYKFNLSKWYISDKIGDNCADKNN